MISFRPFRFAALYLAAVAMALAQTSTGVITGTVLDASGAAVPGATITLIRDDTGVRSSLASEPTGDFNFMSVLPGRYRLAVEASGFKRLEKTNLNVTPGARFVVTPLALEIGAPTEIVIVTAQGEPVQTQSSERSATLTSAQMERLMSRGRNFLALTYSLPGVVSDERSFETDTTQSTLTPSFSGVPRDYNSVFVDGVGLSSPGINPAYSVGNVSIDAIAEVKVAVGNYKAEDGRNAGPAIKTVTKSGTREFHGTAFYYLRNDALNANSFFNNTNGVNRPRYRYNTFGGTIGGPVYLPGINKDRNKVFFFYSTEMLPTTTPRGLTQLTMPTALERAGDFSKTLEVSGALIPIKDSLNNGAPFSGNVIPKSRLDPRGQALLNLLPSPNFSDRSITRGAYNYNYQDNSKQFTSQNLARVDYNLNDQMRLFVRGNLWAQTDESYSTGGQAWPMLYGRRPERFQNWALSHTYTINATLINEFTAGFLYMKERPTYDQDDLARLDRKNLGVSLPQYYPDNNGLNLVPWMSFGGVPSAPRLAYQAQLPRNSLQTSPTITDNITKIVGPHTLKFGAYLEYSRYAEGTGSATFPGEFDFGRNVNNPFDSNWAFSNALLGVYSTYKESNSRPPSDARGKLFEWFAQDTWRATKRLTFDIGLRMSYFTPWYQASGKGLNFDPSRYDFSKAVQLYEPALDAKGKRVGRNPLTGELVIPNLIGAIVPGSGDPNNGMVSQSDSGVPRGFVDNRGVYFAPRAGFAYDVFGNGKTALRGGFGVSYATQGGWSQPWAMINNTIADVNSYNGTFDTLLGAPGTLFPRNVTSISQDLRPYTLYTASLGVQQELFKGTVLDVSYVATLGRNVLQNQNLATVAPGSRFLPENTDQTTKKPLPDNFFRPYPGYNGITTYRTTSSNYHGLQIQANRRFASSLQLSLGYTWSKTMGYSGFGLYYDNDLNYGKTSFDRTHSMNGTVLYDIPALSKVVRAAPVKWIFDDWQMAGIFMLQSGRPYGVSYSLVSGADLMGGGDYNRVYMLDKAQLSRSDRSFTRFFNTDAFAPPTGPNAPGNAPQDVFRGPGRTNLDFTLYKNIKIWERVTTQLRWENYNVFNHASFYIVDSAARFDNAGKQVNTRFGQMTNSLTPRIIQVALRITF